MSDATTPPPPVPTPPGVEAPAMSAQEINDGKAFAVLSYAINFVGLPFWLVPLIMRSNEFSLYHSKQCLLMWLIGLATGMVAIVPCAGWILALVVFVGLLVFNIMGLINAINGKAVPLPLIGKLAEQWFAGVRKTGT